MRPTTHRFRPAVEGIESRDLPSTMSAVAMLGVHAAAHRAPAVAVVTVAPADGWDRTRFASERGEITPRDYPRLGRNYEIIAPATDRYNCISFSLGFRDRWIDPHTGPAGAPFVYEDRLYAKEGYQRLPTLDMSLQPGEQKVALLGFTNRKGTVTSVAHATIQLADGTWMSKLGDLPLIRHPSPDSLDGPLYGRPIAVYERAT